jgi:GNAT superfamily N-acetyltransferase
VEIKIDGLNAVCGENYASCSLRDDEFHIEQDDITGEEIEVYDEYVKIEHVFVTPADRGQGIAKRMIAAVVANALTLHPKCVITLAALPEKDKPLDQAALVSLYEKCGFKVSKNQGSEAVVMEYHA